MSKLNFNQEIFYLDIWIEQLKIGVNIIIKDILKKEPNVFKISPPISIYGSIKGQFNDLIELFQIAGYPPYSNFLFLCDYIDRMSNFIECINFIIIF